MLAKAAGITKTIIRMTIGIKGYLRAAAITAEGFNPPLIVLSGIKFIVVLNFKQATYCEYQNLGVFRDLVFNALDQPVVYSQTSRGH